MEVIRGSDEEKSVFDSIKLYATEQHLNDIEGVLFAEDVSVHFSITVHAMSLLEMSVEFGQFLLNHPDKTLKLLDAAFYSASLDVYTFHASKDQMTIKPNIHARLTALPLCTELYRAVLPKSADVRKFMCITGTVIRTTAVKMLEYRKMWRCSKCKHEFHVDADIQQFFAFAKPAVCPNPIKCGGKNFALLSNEMNSSWCKDYQEVKIQEQTQHLVVGTLPKSMWVVLENDLVDICQPGHDVNIRYNKM